MIFMLYLMLFHAGSCTITPLNPTSLTTTGGEIPSGTMNVRIQCTCMDSNGMTVDVVRWRDLAGDLLISAQNGNFDASVPHFTRVNNTNNNIELVIPTFSDSYDGTYTCGRRDPDDATSLIAPTTDVTLVCELLTSTIQLLVCV